MFFRNPFTIGITFFIQWDGFGLMSYATIAEAETYLVANKLSYSAWTEATTSEQTVALQVATTIMDRLNFKGEKTEDSQELQFPRDGETAIPQDIKNACTEIAYSLLDGVDIDLERDRQAILFEQYASVKTSYNPNVVRPHLSAGVPSQVAWDILTPYLRSQSYTVFHL